MERGYASSPESLADNASRMIEAGVVGLNLEDGLAGGGLREASEQAAQIAAVREAATAHAVDIFINARTDAFFVHGETEDALEAAIDRASAYAAAGATGLFAPGLNDPVLIKRLCDRSKLPVNIMVGLGKDARDYGRLDVARLSLGPAAYLAVKALAAETIARELGSGFSS
jgi:2-methylisocitrate lyase-like PEP mutase family enzyme